MNAWYSQFIEALFDPNDNICTVTIKDKELLQDGEKKVIHVFATRDRLLTEQAFTYLNQANQQLYSVYVAMNPFKDHLDGKVDGRTEENVAKIKRLYADADDNGIEAFEKLKTSTTLPQPHIVLETSPGKYQFIWNVDGLDQPTAKRMLKAIAAELGTDPAVAETARVFRIPGFVNRKKKYTGEPIVKLVGDILNREPYRPEDFKLNLNAPAEAAKPKAEDWLNEPFIHGQLDNQIVRLIGHYITSKNISDADEMYALVTAKIEANGCFERNGVPYQWNDARVRELCRLKTKNWKTGEEQKQEAISEALAESTKIGEQAKEAAQTADDVEVPTFEKGEYPTFPSYVMSGTSLYENFVKPVCDRNSQRAEHFMWLPATALLLNYLGTKVQTKGEFASEPFNGSQYLVLIGKRGEAIKSSSVDDAMSYFNYIGCLTHDGGLKTADGKTVVWTAGSAEGLGIEMQKTNCKNAVLFYDELSQLVKKAGIECSTMASNLLTLYESKKFGNKVKKGKEAFSLDPGSYCFSLMTCSTTETFHDLWSRLNGNDTGLDNRFMFVLQPETIRKSPKVSVNIFENATVTRQLIDKAINQGVFEFDGLLDNPKYLKLVNRGVRYAERAKKWALAIAVDLGLNFIDSESIDRGCDVVNYELAVKEHIKTFDAQNKEAALQQVIRRLLEDAQGSMLERELRKKAKADSAGTSLWGQAFYGLQKAGIIRMLGTGAKRDPRIVQVLVRLDSEEES